MPGRRCAVFGCNNSRVSTKASNPGIVYHNFPKGKDSVSNTARKEWIRRCKRADSWNSQTSQICSVHFTDNDYERDMRNEILGLPIRKLLKRDAVPSLNLPNMAKNATCSERKERYAQRKKMDEIRQRKEEINNLIAEQSTASTSTLNINESVNVIEEQCEQSDDDISIKHDKLLESHKKLQTLMDSMKYKLYLQQKQLRHYKMNTPERALPKIVGSNILKKFLTKNQIAILLGRRKCVNWNTDEIAMAFTIRYLSKRCYLFLRSKLNFPLPALSTLRRWASRIQIKQGILKDVLTFLKIAGENMTKRERTVVLSFDEINVKSVLEYDDAKDQISGRYDLMQVCMARSLFSTWKQPVYIDFDKKITKDILIDIITELHNVKYNCVAIVSNCESNNVDLWMQLSVDMNKTHFNHPQTQKKIYVFVDAPNLLKLLRNWLLDTGFILGDNTKIIKSPLEFLIELTNAELNSSFKISEKHIIVEKSQRQSVRLAAELFSHSTAQTLLQYKPGPDKKIAEDLGKFIDDINIWFDIFNSYVKDSSIIYPMKAPFGIYLEQQAQHLDKVKNLILCMRPEGKTTLQIFQKGIIMSIESLKLLLRDMNDEFKEIHYLCTCKLNQECLENFFIQIRCRDSNEHPSPLEAMKRIRMIILEKNPNILDAQVNVQETVSEEYMVARVLKEATVLVQLPSNEEFESSGNQGNSSGSSSLLSRFLESDANMPEVTDDAIKYIAGFIATKFESIHPELCDYTYKITFDHSYSLPTREQQISFGGLIKPSLDFLKTVKRWNRYFIMFHGNDKLRRGPSIVTKLALRIKKRDNLSINVINLFCKLRTVVRINYLNAKVHNNKIQHLRKRTFMSTPNVNTEHQMTKKIQKTN